MKSIPKLQRLLQLSEFPIPKAMHNMDVRNQALALSKLQGGTTELYYHYLYWLAKEYLDDEDVVLVLGVANATCCAHISVGCQADIIGIDNKFNELAADLADLYTFEYVVDDTTGPKVVRLLEDIRAGDLAVSMVFFDSTHEYQQVEREFKLIRPYLRDGAILLWDDIMANGVGDFAQSVEGSFVSLHHLHPTLGFGITIYKTRL